MHDSYDAQTGSASRGAVVIEDDPDIRDLIATVLQQSGFTVHGATGGADGVELALEHRPAVVTLDIGLPDIDGFEVARRIRLASDCYIVIVSARTDETETLMGLAAGADDFITKPFRPRELRARIAAMLRRPRVFDPATAAEEPPRHEDGEEAATTGAASATTAIVVVSADTAPEADASEGGTDVLERQGLSIDPQTRSVWLDDDALELTRTEFDLLHTLMGSGRRVRTKADLVRHLRADSLMSEAYVSEADERSVEVHIGNVRRKLGRTGQSAVWIETVRGVGYRMAADPAQPLKP